MEDDLAHHLAAAQRAQRHELDPAPFASLDREAAYRVQARVRDLLGETIGALKVGIAADGKAIVAPIYRTSVGESGKLALPVGNFVGLEVEIGVVLGRDLTPSIAAQGEAAMTGAINHFIMGIEVIGTRFTDRKAAGAEGGLADCLSTLGYAVGTTPWPRGEAISGLQVQLDYNGKTIHSGPARHAFGTVLNSFFAYAREQRPEYPLTAGMVVTTGSLCGLVPAAGPGRAVARMGDQSVSVDIVET